MSGYFDGLMRASGLPLGAAPVIGPAARAPLGLEAVQPQPVAGLPAATPQAPPAPLAARQPRDAASWSAVPQQPQRPVHTGLPRTEHPTAPEQPPGPADMASKKVSRRRETAPMQTLVAAPVKPAASTPERPAAAATAAPQPGISRERLIQAAMRWVASEPEPATPEPVRVAVAKATRVPQRSPETPARDAPRSAVAQVSQMAEVLIHAEAPRSAAAELLPTRQHPPQKSTLAEPDSEGLQVSIGAIHLRVDAPPAPALQAAPAARHPAPPPTVASSGLSRRALRRL